MYDAIFFTDVTQAESQGVELALGAFKVASSLRQQGYKCLVVNHLWQWSLEELKDLLSLVVSNQTKLIGFSTTFIKEVSRSTPSETPSFRFPYNYIVFPQGKDFENTVVEFIKTLNSDVKLAAGGTRIHPNFQNKNIDYAFIGYSEVSIVNLLNHLSTGEELKNTYKNIHGVFIVDDKLAPTYNFASDSMIWEETDICNHKVLPIEIGRGCVFNCSFCSYPLRGKNNLDYIRHAEILRDELMSNYKKFGITHYRLVDDTFNDHTDKLLMFRDLVKSLPFQPYFWCYARLDLLTTRPETIDLLYEIGCRALYFGIETMNERTGRHIGKGFSRSRQNETIVYIKEKYPDIMLHGSLIIGLPGDTEDDILSTFNRLVNQEIKLDTWSLRPMVLFKPGTVTFTSSFEDNMEKHGYSVEKETDDYYIHWKNENFTFIQAYNLSNELMKKSFQSANYKLDGHLVFQYVELGYDIFELMKINFREWDFHKIAKEDHPNFIDTYKRIMLELIHEQINKE